MKHILPLSISLLLSITINAQPAIECPADITVEWVDFNNTYEYGEPIIHIQQPFNLTVNLERTSNDCSADHIESGLKEWTLTYDNSSESCSQFIGVKQNSFDDYTPPANVDLASGDPYNISPDLTGYYGPESFFDGVIAATYEDTVLPSGTGYKVLRRWTLLNWCTTEILEHFQIIKIGLGIGNDLTVIKPNGDLISGYTFELLDDSGNELPRGDCDGNIVEIINCIYNNNMDIPEINLVLSNESGFLNGVSTLDIVLIQKHILGITPFNDSYKSIAADINNDNKVSASDLIELKKAILAIYTSFPNNVSWRFYNANSALDLEFTNDELPLNGLTVYGVKIGDVNYSSN